MKEKGFTLVELSGVIVVLIITNHTHTWSSIKEKLNSYSGALGGQVVEYIILPS